MTEKITNEKELLDAINIANSSMQMIQDYLMENPKLVSKNQIRFPRGYIRKATFFRNRLSFIEDGNLKSNLSYNMMLADINNWIIAYTDLSGTALEMSIKWQIALMTSVSEAIIKDVTKAKIGKSHSFYKRCDKMFELNMITESLKNELHWLWDIRGNIHIGEIDGSEYQKYGISHYSRAKKAIFNLCKELRITFNNTSP
ncbi:MAG: hypothetical protein ACJAT4_000047 [Granulosicoccus sp.]|jgi:hypothetical protein